MTPANVLARAPRPTTKSYREAVKRTVLALQAKHSLTDQDLAERVDCSAGTIKNARNEAGNLDGKTLAVIEHEFGPGAVDPFLRLGGSRAVPLGERRSEVNVTLELAEALHRLIETQHPGSDGGTAITPAELRAVLPFLIDARGALDALISEAEL